MPENSLAGQAPPSEARLVEAEALERRVAASVNEAYGLTAEEVELMWRTAPPRMPVGRRSGTGDVDPLMPGR